MSADRVAIVGCLLLGMSVVLADDEQTPDADFLEYLGSWEGSDEDWQIFVVPVTADAEEERNEPVPEGEDSTETTDES